MDFVEGETGSCIETHVKCDVDGTEEVGIKVEEALDIKEEVGIKVEEAIDIKDENPQAVMFPPIMTEQEVRLWGLCEVLAAYACRQFIAPKRKLLNYTLLCPAVCYVLSSA
jgi:hypothetical protein